jgi:Galactose oxidase, central domain
MNLRIAIVAALLGGCSSGTGQAPSIASFSSDPAAVFVGDRARLTAVFDGDTASIDGIGAVRSGVPIDTPPLSRSTTFKVHVSRDDNEVTATATVPANYRNRIRRLAPAPIAQTTHLAAALPDGRALVMGGNTSVSLNVPDSTLTQVFDPATETFAPGPDLKLTVAAKEFTSVAQLSGGGFLLAGAGVNAGAGGATSVATQMFDGAAGSFTRVGDAVTTGVADRTATPLADGGVLLTGGLTLSRVADRYDAASARWRAAGEITQLRAAHTATLLRDGRVLLAGGLTCCQEPNPSPQFFADTAEVYDPASDTFTATGTLGAARGLHAAALLPDGRVLLTGGDGNDPGHPPLSTEIYDPATGQFSPAGDLQAARDSHAAVALTDGRVLVIGGEVPPGVAGSVGVGVLSTEIFDPATGRWSAGPVLDPAFYAATVTLLANGKVLVFGGEDPGGFPQSAAALFE